MSKKLILAVILLFVVNTAAAATIHGTIYNLELEKQPDVIITVDSTPKQTLVSKDGAYSFNLPEGVYTITAEYDEESAKESIAIQQSGEYVLDLILFPTFAEEEFLEEADENLLEDEYFSSPVPLYVTVLIIIALMAVFIFIVLKYKRLLKRFTEELQDNLQEADVADKVYDFIKKEKRVTQKQIRNRFPSSEAKISLILKELEHKGKIEKIKKGRGNIILLKK